MKSEPGSSAVDHETGKVRGATLEEPCRQYHLQQLGDNRRLWVQSHLIIPFTGIADYEQLAIQDVKNINKIYKIVFTLIALGNYVKGYILGTNKYIHDLKVYILT